MREAIARDDEARADALDAAAELEPDMVAAAGMRAVAQHLRAQAAVARATAIPAPPA